MIIAVDFDGTLHTGKWPEIGCPTPYSVEAMRQLKSDGHDLVIWTCREGGRQTEMVNWLLEAGIPFDRVNDHIPGSWEAYGYKSKKVYAHLYIDDKQVGGLPPWRDIYNYVKEVEERYKGRFE
jgi:hydroxymethylpyrimidine pyrophosphatase-like HAD family hydrolase